MANISDTMSTYTTFKQGDVIPAGFPMAGATVSQGFNDKTTNLKGHLGYDITRDNLEACALFDGTIAKITINPNRANGNSICVKHQIGTTVFYSTYCHLASIRPGLAEGDTVSRNEYIATIGNSSSIANLQVHLHVCVFTAETWNDDPMGYCHSDSHHTFEEVSQFANEYYYGADPTRFPRCGGVCFYDPYAVVSTNGAVLRHSDYSIYDVNHDGVVDQLDLTRAQRNYGRYDPLSDINGDGIVDIADLILLINNYDN